MTKVTFVLGIIFCSQFVLAQEGYMMPKSTIFNCKEDYLLEINRINDIKNSDETKEAESVLSNRSQRLLVGNAIGSGLAILTLSTVKDDGLGYAMSMGGYAGSLFLSRYATSKSNRIKEKEAKRYITELDRTYQAIRNGYDVVLSSKKVSEREKYTPEELRESYFHLNQFIKEFDLEIKAVDLSLKIMSGDANTEICADHNPMDKYELAAWLKQ